jgi:transcriptional regulator with XRE-family HTH domain
MDTQSSLGEFIRDRRKELGLTQEELAERIGEGVQQAEISRLERDRVGLPRRARLERIAVALQLPHSELLARTGWAGSESVSWAPNNEHILEPSRPPERSAVPGTPLTLPGAGELLEAIAQARETSSRTRSLLAQSEKTYDLVCRSVTRAHPEQISEEMLNEG